MEMTLLLSHSGAVVVIAVLVLATVVVSSAKYA